MPGLKHPAAPSLGALRSLFKASAAAEHAVRERRFVGSPAQLQLLEAMVACHPCAIIDADIAVLRDALDTAKVGLPFTTNQE